MQQVKKVCFLAIKRSNEKQNEVSITSQLTATVTQGKTVIKELMTLSKAMYST